MSKLARSEICQKCAECCKEFAMNVSEDIATRFKLLEHPKIIVEECKTFDGSFYWIVHFKIKCSKLRYDNEKEKYYCSIYPSMVGDENRPLMCLEYPDNVPFAEWSGDNEYCRIIKESLKRIEV